MTGRNTEIDLMTNRECRAALAWISRRYPQIFDEAVAGTHAREDTSSKEGPDDDG